MKDYQKFISFIVLFAAGFYWLDSSVHIPFLSAGVISGALFLLFLWWDRYCWKYKHPIMKAVCWLIGFHCYPNLNGTWNAEYSSSYNYDFKRNEYRTFGNGVVKIRQTYSAIFVEGKFGESSEFESLVATLKQKENGNWFLTYVYRSNPINIKLKKSPSGGMHIGFSYLEFQSGDLIGFYSNDENRQTRGKLKLTKAQ